VHIAAILLNSLIFNFYLLTNSNNYAILYKRGDDVKINETLKKLRNSKKLSQSDMADILEVSLSSYQKYERDKNCITPSLDVLMRIADFYNVSIDYLLGRETGEPETIDKLAGEFNMSALEKEILDNYLSLPKDMRGDLMEFLQKSVQKVMNESGE
jgi:transcriptional regulator with XRE-family HTH domain